jgi:tRNA-binding EMAP/Myf-like protein
MIIEMRRKDIRRYVCGDKSHTYPRHVSALLNLSASPIAAIPSAPMLLCARLCGEREREREDGRSRKRERG